MPKSPIWLDHFEMEILRGYLAQLIEEKNLPNYALAVLNSAYEQTIEKG
jgi:hypothetical protein